MAETDQDIPADAFRSGFAALVGRANAGKSTLINALVGEKISIVTPKAQTTRHALVGILHRPDAQIALVDTPGLDLRPRRLLNQVMNRAVAGVLAGADLAVVLVPATGWKPADEAVVAQARATGKPMILVITKIDLVRPREALLPLIKDYSARAPFADVVPVSARRGQNIEVLVDTVSRYLPEGPRLYPEEMRTDRGLSFRVAETIREKLMLVLREEVPYGLAVEIESLDDKPGRLLVQAVIWVERESQKGIVVGRGGAQIRSVGSAARLELEHTLGRSVFLDLRVRLKRNWSDSERAIRQFGYREDPG